MQRPTRFYVYKLIDPRNHRVFYVGKGKDDRAWHHTNEVARGKYGGNQAKVAIILKILARKRKPIIEIVAEFDSEDDAFKHEIELIATIPGLCNLKSGGQGRSMSGEEKKIRTRIKDRKIAAKRLQYLKGWLARAEGWQNGCTIPLHPNGDALGAEFLSIVRATVASSEWLPNA